MDTNNTEIYNHDDDLEVTHKINTIELENWITHITYIEKELNNLIGLCKQQVNEAEDKESILERFLEKKAKNEVLKMALEKYSLSRANLKECEDMACDMVYISEHESYRLRYLVHLDSYRTIKDDFFSKVQANTEVENNK
ncbi:hypothetical protein ES677_12675 [Bizionia gelidisalsuginis]|uniref:Uncharacterized protein n=2 Tax=Bizionia TaxID=283785 RepID=A0A8H2LH02_9FLAO|nr:MULTISPECIES: hypothetical protein [Bizionia]TYB80379.1 hypothetical protein ES676_01560 [Bizionia saleffrena]TYC09673.1 hypothetical protein ES677_12675 [Bizionia gelidisalsuginis]